MTPRNRPLGLPLVPAILIAVNVLVEAVLLAADHRILGSPIWRALAYGNGAFWSGLLRDWRPNFPGQPATMFVTYSFLHAGPGHLIGNMIMLALLGKPLSDRLGGWRFAAIYGLSALGGGVAFGLLSSSAAPMVGASGAIFGLAGAGLVHYWQEQRSLRGLAGAVVGLVALNALTWLMLGGQLAWETHLGGLVAGALATLALDPGRRPGQPIV
ncbi:rhomboid family intramembrane serine protease [Rubellimicrobium arenae]|uniref:rhomboid family intramembrane serine protease n=1 Tax=Rubellimicrobium arenae TaxID=2817372 RepID=UPI001B308A37|nr:rhomboid family intramembrane serine protease [Rubellimicrobium arenae]